MMARDKRYRSGDNIIKYYEDGHKMFEFHDTNPERLVKNSFSTIKKKLGIW